MSPLVFWIVFGVGVLGFLNLLLLIVLVLAHWHDGDEQ